MASSTVSTLSELRRLFWAGDNQARMAILAQTKEPALCKQCYRPLRPEDRDEDLCIWCQIVGGLPLFKAQSFLEGRITTGGTAKPGGTTKQLPFSGKKPRRKEKKGFVRPNHCALCKTQDLLLDVEKEHEVCWGCLTALGHDPSELSRQPKFSEIEKVVIPPKEEPRPDPAILREIVGMAVGIPDTLTKPVTFSIGEKGLFLIKQTKVGRFVRAVTEKDLKTFPEIAPAFVPALPKIPFEILGQIVNFFRSLPEIEVFVQIWWDPPEGCYTVEVPPQEVGGAHIDHDGGVDTKGGRILVLDIHSHTAKMGGFFSGTDDQDERRFERLFGVIGKVSDPIPEMKFRASVGGEFISLVLGDVFEIPAQDVTVTVPLRESLTGTRYFLSVDPFRGIDFPPEWKDAVVERSVSVSGGHSYTLWRGHNYHGD